MDAFSIRLQNNIENFAFKAASNLYTPGENLVYSPASLNTALGLLLEATGGLTQKEIINSLVDPRFSGDEKEERKISNFLVELGKGHKDGIQKLVTSANFIYFDQNFDIPKSYAKTINKKYNATTGRFNFFQPEGRAEAAKTINDNVNRVTRGLIPTIIDESQIHNKSSALIINALHFKGVWQTRFEKSRTATDGPGSNFKLSNGEIIQTPRMHSKSTYRIGQYKNYKTELLVLPYNSGTKDEQIYMVFVLPEDGKIKEFLADFDAKKFNEAIENAYSYSDADISLPRFKIDSEYSLKSTLRRLGVKKVFGRHADFSRIWSPTKDTCICTIKVSKVIQRAVIEVNEEGTEAAAVTYINSRIVFKPSMPPPRASFHADRPFVYALIAENKNKLKNILFAGVVENPELQ